MRPGVLIWRPVGVLRLTLAQACTVVVRHACAAAPGIVANCLKVAPFPDVLLLAAGHQPLQHGGAVRWLAPQQGNHRQADEVHGTHHQAAGGQAVGSLRLEVGHLFIKTAIIKPASQPASPACFHAPPLYTDRSQLQLNLRVWHSTYIFTVPFDMHDMTRSVHCSYTYCLYLHRCNMHTPQTRMRRCGSPAGGGGSGGGATTVHTLHRSWFQGATASCAVASRLAVAAATAYHELAAGGCAALRAGRLPARAARLCVRLRRV